MIDTQEKAGYPASSTESRNERGDVSLFFGHGDSVKSFSPNGERGREKSPHSSVDALRSDVTVKSEFP